MVDREVERPNLELLPPNPYGKAGNEEKKKTCDLDIKSYSEQQNYKEIKNRMKNTTQLTNI